MNKIYLVGDSYFEEELYNSLNHSTWIQMIRKKYSDTFEIVNLSISGAGPHRNLSILKKLFFEDEIVTKNDIIISHVSGIDRIQFFNNENIYSSNIGWNSESKTVYCTLSKDMHLNDMQKKILSFYENFKSEIDFACLTFDKLLLGLGFFMTSFLYTMSQSIKAKTIVFNDADILEKKYFQILNNKYFHSSKYNLFDLSFDEVLYDEVDQVANFLKTDLRRNHFSYENHENMYQYLCDIIEIGTSKVKFKKNFRNYDQIYRIISKNHPNKRKFIYE